jgi:WD40 repeat protein
MSHDDDRLDDILDAWLEAFDRGTDLPAAELCRDCPDLIPEVERRVALLRRVAELKRGSDVGATLSECGPGGVESTATADGCAATPDLVPAAAAPPGYVIEGELGRGGMGVVYRARQVNAGRVVALKVVRSGGHASPVELARFRTEAHAVARLQHPNVVPVFEVGEVGGLPFFSMEFCPGGNLAAKLGGDPLPPREAAALIRRLAEGVAAAHAAGIVHRDLKPGNVLLAADGTPKVTDFGLAKLLDAAAGLTGTEAVMGTPSYMAPEQATGDARGVGPAADVYGLGAVLFECLTGRPPFKGASAADTIVQVRTQDPVAVRALVPGVPRDLETVCHKCLAKDPQKRYATAAELGADLDRFLAGRAVLARPVGGAERAWRWTRRHPGTAALAGLVVLLMVGVTVGSLVAASHFDRLARQAEETADAEREAKEQAAKQQAEAEERKQEADRRRKDTERLVARQYVEAGSRLVADGDVAGALLWNVAALEADPEQSDMVRTRLAQMLRQTPVPAHAFFHDAPITMFRIDPTGRTVAVVCENRTVVLYDLESGKHLHTLKHERGVFSAEFTPDGSRVATLSGDDASVPAAEVSPDEVRVWGVADGKPLTPPLRHHFFAYGYEYGFDSGGLADAVTSSSTVSSHLCLNGERLLLCPDDRTCKLYDAATGKEVATVHRTTGRVLYGAELSPDGTRVLLGEVPEGSRPEPDPRGSVPVGTFRVIDLTDPKRSAGWEATAPGSAGGRRSVVFSPDGGFLLAASEAGYRVYDRGGRVVVERLAAVPKGPPGGGPGSGRGGWSNRPFQTRFSPDGRFLSIITPGAATGPAIAPAKEAVILDLHTKREVKLPPTITSVIEFGPRAAFLLARAAGGRFAVLNASTAEEVCQLPAEAAGTAKLSPDGLHVLISGRDTVVEVYDRNTGRGTLPLLPHEAPVTHWEFTPDASRVVTASGSVLRAWPLARRADSTRTIPLDLSSTGWSASGSGFITPDGRRIVTFTSGPAPVRIWDANTGKPVSDPIAPVVDQDARGGYLRSATPAAAFDPSGDWLLLSSDGGRGGPGGPFDGSGSSDCWVLHLPTAKLYRWPPTVPQRPRGGFGKEKRGPATFSRYWSATAGTPLWSPRGGHLLRTTNYVDVRPDAPGGSYGLRGFGGSETFDAGVLFSPPPPKSVVAVVGPDGKPVSPVLSFPGVVRAAWAPDGRHVATMNAVGNELRVELWAFEPGKPLTRVREFPSVTVRTNLEEVASRDRSWEPKQEPVLSFSPDGRRLLVQWRIGFEEEVIRIWDATSGLAASPLEKLSGGATTWRLYGGVPQFGPDGAVLFAEGHQQQLRGVRVIDVATGKDRIPMMVPTGDFHGFAVSPDGTRVLTWGEKAAQLWDVRTGELLSKPLQHEAGVSSAAFTADGRRVVTVTGSGGRGGPYGPRGYGGTPNASDIRIWDAETGQPVVLGVGNSWGLLWDRNATRVLQTTATRELVVHDLTPDPRPAEELRELAEALAARRVSGGGGLVVVNPARLAASWEKTAASRAAWGGAVTGKEWYNRQLEQSRVVDSTPARRWYLDQLLAVDPANRERRFLRADLAARAGDWEQVVADLTGLPGDPLTGSRLERLARAQAELGRWEEARRDYLEAAKPPAGSKGPPVSSRYETTTTVALIELKLGRREEFTRLMRKMEGDIETLLSRAASGALQGSYPQYLWPTLLLGGTPPKSLVALVEAPPPKVDPSDPRGGFGSSGRVTVSFPLAAGVAYRKGEAEKVLRLLEPKFGSEVGCTTAECFLLAMAAKKQGNDALAEKALARGIELMADPTKHPRPAEWYSGGLDGGYVSSGPTWQTRLANEWLRREAEELVRGKNP